MKTNRSIIVITSGLIASFILGGFLAGLALKNKFVQILNTQAASQIVILHNALRTADDGSINATRIALANALRSSLFRYDINISVENGVADDNYVREAQAYLNTRDKMTEQPLSPP